MVFPFDDNFAEYMTNQVPESQALSDYTPRTIADEIVLTSTPTLVKLELTQEQYLKIVSSLFTGAWWVYPNEWLEVMASFWQGVSILDCEFVNGCIENSEDTQQTLSNFLAANGFTPNFRDATNAQSLLSASDTAGNLIPSDFPCNDAQIMALSRKITQELNQSTEDLLEVIELVTSSVELAEIVTQYIPMVGIYVEFVSWLYDTLQEFYIASYDQDVEDEIACALYCVAIDDCDLSLDDMLQVMVDIGGFSLPDNPNDALSVLTWASELELSLSVTTVANFFWIVLTLMKFGGGLQGFVGIGDLKSTIKATREWSDYSYEDCDCAPAEVPTDYWKIYANFDLGLGQWELQSGTVLSGGIVSTVNGGGVNQAVIVINDLSDTFQVKCAGTITQRRGATGSGGGDQNRTRAYPLINTGGTPQDISFQSFITCNTNTCDDQEEVSGGGTQPAKSLQCYVRDNGNYNAVNNFVKLREIVIFGLCNTGQIKPTQAVYVSSIPTIGNLFD